MRRRRSPRAESSDSKTKPDPACNPGWHPSSLPSTQLAILAGTLPLDAAFSRLDRHDRDGSSHSVRLSGEVGRAFDVYLSSMKDAGSAPTSTPAPPVMPVFDTANHTGARLLDWYKSRVNYDGIVRSFRTRYNMCANFATMALERSGALHIPRGARYVGYDDDGTAKSVRAWVPSLARYLEVEKGWTRIYNTADIKPGDLVVTAGREGTYNHVMMVDSWIDQGSGYARVTDNRAFRYARHLDGGGRYSPMMYALRGP